MRSKNILISNLSYALLAQVVSLAASFAVQFFAPKVLSIAEYAYWQLFLFYVSYINISRIGIIDGLYLKLGGKERTELDGALLKTEWIVFLAFQVLVAVVMWGVVCRHVVDENRLFVLLACSICMVIINSNNYFGFIFQAINETNIYSISELIYNLLWFVAVVLLYCSGIKSYKIIVIMYIGGQALAGIYLLYNGRFILHCKAKKLCAVFADIMENSKCGISLLIAMYASMLITGVARLVVDGKWGIEMFGYFSFAMSLTTFLLKFISQVSMVLFPALRKVAPTEQRAIFSNINNIMTVILPAALIMFIPMKVLVNWWLPQYNSSMYYLGILLPICVFDGKMQLLYSTYLKVLRKERYLLLVNGVAVVTSFGLSLIGAWIINDIEFIAWALLVSIALRSMLAEVGLTRWLGLKPNRTLQITEIIAIMLFPVLATHLSDMHIFLIYVIIYIAYVIINRAYINSAIEQIKLYFVKK